jgi:hypothetical protein
LSGGVASFFSELVRRSREGSRIGDQSGIADLNAVLEEAEDLELVVKLMERQSRFVVLVFVGLTPRRLLLCYKRPQAQGWPLQVIGGVYACPRAGVRIKKVAFKLRWPSKSQGSIVLETPAGTKYFTGEGSKVQALQEAVLRA